MDITYQSSNNDILNAIKHSTDQNKVQYYRELLVLKNRNLVSSAIKPYVGIFNRDDMFQDGMMTLLSTIDTFDPDRSTISFSTYATRAIRNNVLNIGNSNKSVVTVPVDFNHHSVTVYRVQQSFIEKNQRLPTVSELATLTGLAEERVKCVLNATDFTHTMSLDEPVGDDNSPLYEVIPADDQDQIIDLDKIKDLLESLNDNELELIHSFFGVLGTEKKTATEMLDDGCKTADGKTIKSKQSIHNHVKYTIGKIRRYTRQQSTNFNDYFMHS